MGRRLAVLVAIMLLFSGCRYQEVNRVSLFKYRRTDDTGTTILKTAGNLLPWTAEAACFLAAIGTVAGYIAGWLYLESKAG